MMEGKAGQEMKFPRVFYNMSNQMNQIMVSLLKQDKSKNSYAFVDQIREFIVGNYQNYLKGELVDFGIGELDEGEGFKLNIMMKEEKVKLQKSRVTDLIQSEVKVNVKYDEDEVKLEVYGGWDEKIEKCKVKSYN